MAVTNVNSLEPMDDILRITTKPAPPADIQLIDPNNALCYYGGEWVVLNTDEKYVRASTIGSVGNENSNALAYPLWLDRGSSDSMAHPQGMISAIIGPKGIRMRTKVYNPSVAVGSGAVISGAHGQGLKVATITLSSPQGSRNFSGLVGHGGSGDSSPIVARTLWVRNGVLAFQTVLSVAIHRPHQRNTGEPMSLSNLMSSGLADRLTSPDGQMKVADLSGKLIFDRLREQAFSSPILAMRPIGIDECQLSENSDTLVKMEFMEPQSRAMSMNFRGDSESRIIRADRAFMSFYTIASEIFQKTEEEMQIYRSIPVSQILERNTLKDMEELRDHGFLTHCEAAVQYMQKEANGGTDTELSCSSLQSATPPEEFSVIKGELARSATAGSESTVPFNIQRPDFVALKKTLSKNRLEHSCVLLSAPDLDGVDAWTLEDTGDRVQSETHGAGFTGNKLLGIKIIRSIKSDILVPGNVYLFTAPHFLGRFYLLNRTKFYVDKRFNRISWQAWETLGMILLNVASVKKLELYSADASPVDANSLRTAVSPKAERDLGAKNNRLVEGGRFPTVTSLL